MVSWAGVEFCYHPGQEIELPDYIATARIAEGLCRAVATADLPRRRARPTAEAADTPEE